MSSRRMMMRAAGAVLVCAWASAARADYTALLREAVARWDFAGNLEDANPPHSQGRGLGKAFHRGGGGTVEETRAVEESDMVFNTSTVPETTTIPGAVYSPGSDGQAVRLWEDTIDFGLGAEGQLCVRGAFTLFARIRPERVARGNPILAKRGTYALSIHNEMGRVDGVYGVLRSGFRFAVTPEGGRPVHVEAPADIPVVFCRNSNAVVNVAHRGSPHAQWFDLAAVFEPGRRLEIHVNGALAAALEGPVPDRLACDPQWPVLAGGAFFGDLELLVFWDRALTPGEVAALSEAGGRR